MRFSSKSEAELLFNKLFLKKILTDIKSNLSKTNFESRFFKFQSEIIYEVFNEVETEHYFSKIEKNILAEIFEKIFIYYISEIKTTEISKFDEIELSEHINTTGFKILENELWAVKPEARDKFSKKFIEKQTTFLLNDLFLDICFYIFKREIRKNSSIELMEEKFVNNLCKEINEHTEQKFIFKNEMIKSFCLKKFMDFKDSKKSRNFLLEIIKKEVSSEEEYNYIKSFLKKIFIDSIFLTIQIREIDTESEYREYLENNYSNYKLFMQEFETTLISKENYIKCFIPLQEQIPKTLLEYLKAEVMDVSEIKESLKGNKHNKLIDFYNFNEYIVFNVKHYNNDFYYVIKIIKEMINEKLSQISFLYNAETSLETNWKYCFLCKYEGEKITWLFIPGGKSDQKILDQSLIRNDDIEKFHKSLEILNSHPFFPRIKELFSLYFMALKNLNEEDLSDCLGKLWLCLEVITQNDKKDKICELVSIFPAIYTNDLYTKKYFEKQDNLLDIIEKRKDRYQLYLNSLGTLRNELIFHRNRNQFYDQDKLIEHVEFLFSVIRKIYHVSIEAMLKDASINKFKNIRKYLEDKLKKN